ncbi:hypothetical protein HanIR_Chr15g0731931 [Helianthus annuus]|nr:hypothetical protein HanIR_Chr15g0731931 [Helianthus annuus]
MLEDSARACVRAQVTLVRAPRSACPCACVLLAQVYARVRHITCEPIRARHTVAPYWLTLVRRARHSRTHAPCARLRAMCTRACMCMTATSCAASPTTWSLQPLCSTTRTRLKIQRRLSSGSRRCERAKCAIKAPSLGECELGSLRENTSVCFHETIRMKSFTLNTHLSSISPPMWDKVLLSLLFQHSMFQTPNFEHRYLIHLTSVLDVV